MEFSSSDIIYLLKKDLKLKSQKSFLGVTVTDFKKSNLAIFNAA